MPLTILIFLITLLVLVLSHEFGHFISAKKFGVKVLEFGFGLPPRLWGKKIGETIYSLNWLPIGGFVKLFGEDEVNKKILGEKDSFAAKPVLMRIVIVVSGVVMNLGLAIVLFWIVLAGQGFKETLPLVSKFNFVGVNQTNRPIVVAVSPNSPASESGIKLGDQIIKFNETELTGDEQFVELTKQHLGQIVHLTLADQDNQRREVSVTLRVSPPQGQGAIGVGLSKVAVLSYDSLKQRILSGPAHSFNLAAYSLNFLGQLLKRSLATHDFQPVSQQLTGPVGITAVANAILQTHSPLLPYLNFVAVLSLNLAIINILPFPALDGGRLLFLLIEAVSRRRVKAEVERWIHAVGMALLLALILAITFSDIKKFF